MGLQFPFSISQSFRQHYSRERIAGARPEFRERVMTVDKLIDENIAVDRELGLEEIENRGHLTKVRDGLARLATPNL
jgi:hypothetical protein